MSKLDVKGHRYYVYIHYDGDERNIVYVGKGSGGRAWDARPTTRGNNGGHNDHCGWICEKVLDSVPFVKIIATRLLSSEALEIEGLLKETLKPKFNTA
jgi:hypothetical protein